MVSILVIDDDPMLCNYQAELLRTVGHVVREASNGADGLHALERGCFDLVLCDMFMPERDGLEVIREVRRRWPDVKVIAMSGGGWGGRLDMLPIAKEFGAAIIRKPFQLPELLALIEASLSAGRTALSAPVSPS